MKLLDFLAVHGASRLDDLDETALLDLRAYLGHRVGRNLEDASETGRPRLRGRAASIARMVETVDAHIAVRGFAAPGPR